MDISQYLTLPEVAKELGVRKSEAHRLVTARPSKLPGSRLVAGRYVVPRQAVVDRLILTGKLPHPDVVARFDHLSDDELLEMVLEAKQSEGRSLVMRQSRIAYLVAAGVIPGQDGW